MANEVLALRESLRISANTQFDDLKGIKDLLEKRAILATAIYYHKQTDAGSLKMFEFYNTELCRFFGLPLDYTRN